MDNTQAKLILGVYRPGGQDASDPFFAEALQRAATDPHLKDWLAEEQAFDTSIASALLTIKGPASGRALIKASVGAPVRQRSWWPMALAASLLVLLTAGYLLKRPTGLVLPEDAALADIATNLAEHHASIGLMTGDIEKARAWLAERSGPVPGNLPAGLAKMMVLGCQTWKTTRGDVSLICYLGENMQMAHLYIFDQVPAGLEGMTLPGMEQPKLKRSGKWSLALWKGQGKSYVLGAPVTGDRVPDMGSFFRA